MLVCSLYKILERFFIFPGCPRGKVNKNIDEKSIVVGRTLFLIKNFAKPCVNLFESSNRLNNACEH